VLFDMDLFRRLRARAQARGADGLPDLVAALRLIRGEPFADLRADSWTWMFEGERFDQEFAAAIVDVAHLVATRSMRDGDLSTARRAAETALSASPYDETARLISQGLPSSKATTPRLRRSEAMVSFVAPTTTAHRLTLPNEH